MQSFYNVHREKNGTKMLCDPNSDNLQKGKWVVIRASKSGDF